MDQSHLDSEWIGDWALGESRRRGEYRRKRASELLRGGVAAGRRDHPPCLGKAHAVYRHENSSFFCVSRPTRANPGSILMKLSGNMYFDQENRRKMWAKLSDQLEKFFLFEECQICAFVEFPSSPQANKTSSTWPERANKTIFGILSSRRIDWYKNLLDLSKTLCQKPRLKSVGLGSNRSPLSSGQ